MLADANGRLPISGHGMLRLKQRRKDVSFEEAVTDVVDSWTQGVDMSIDRLHRDILASIIRRADFERYRYILYKNFLYVFTRNRKLVTILRCQLRR